MLKTTLKLNEEINELKEHIFKEFLCSDSVMNMNGEQFEVYKKMFQLMNTSQELMVRQAETINEINEKLDKLLQK